jgi:hypothetical protein
MTEIIAKVLGVTAHQSSKGNTYHKVALDDGNEYATFKKVNSDIAATLVNQKAYVDVSVEKKGDYTNYNLWGIRAHEDAAPHAPSIVEAAPKEQASRGTMDQETVERITRLSCLRSACEILSGSHLNANGADPILELAEKFYHYAFNGR